jgi:uncharacterized protein (UPF0548 family)
MLDERAPASSSFFNDGPLNNPLFRRPSDELLRLFVDAQRALPFTYESVGGTAPRGEHPAGFAVDRQSVVLGNGREVFLAARQGIEAWAQFDLGWCEAWPRETPLRAGEVVAVVARSMGLWWANAARIVYVVDESVKSTEGVVARFGFAYGTLPGHVEMGEELFLVEWAQGTDAVKYNILAFSRPRHPLARLGRPLVRRLQQRFREDSAAAMQLWVNRAVAAAR